MIREIVKDSNMLHQVCKFSKDKKYNIEVYEDLFDTVLYHQNELNDGCCGLACNQIGITDARVVMVKIKLGWIVMINPIIIDKKGPKIRSTEGCLSCDKEYKVDRYPAIEVAYKNRKFKTQKLYLTGFDAIIAQHELAHLDGKLISDTENLSYEVESGGTLLGKE